MEYEEHLLEEKRRTYARQFGALRDLGQDAAALTLAARPDLARMAQELGTAAGVVGPQYTSMSAPLRGVALARMLAVAARLFEFGNAVDSLERAQYPPGGSRDFGDPTAHFPDLLPRIRGCVKFLSDEIAEYALCLVQDEAGARVAAASEFWRFSRASDQISADHKLAQEIHDRDAAFAASQPEPVLASGSPYLREAPGGAPFDPDTDGWGLGEYPLDEDCGGDACDEEGGDSYCEGEDYGEEGDSYCEGEDCAEEGDSALDGDCDEDDLGENSEGASELGLDELEVLFRELDAEPGQSGKTTDWRPR